MAMIADNDVSAYIPKVVEKVMETERLALRGNAPLLTVLLEIDQQTNNPVLNPHEYKSALRRIVKTAPNARAYIALAECVNANNFPGAVHGYYQNALALEPENVDAFFGAGVVVNNGHRVGISFPEGTPTSLYYFGEAYARGKLLAGNYYGCALYEKASVTGSKKDFLAALKVLEESVHHDQDALLSLADYHSTDHVNKPASFEASFECIKNYMKYDFIDKSKAVEVIENLKASMIRLEYSKTKLFCQISRVQMQWFADESSEMDDRA